MKNSDKPVAFLVGQGGMPVQCAIMLVANGFEIGAVHSPDAPLRDWAEQHNTNYYAEFREFRNAAETTGLDYLFSVMNFRILPASLIGSPRMFAVNYHDAPLPKYAGSHATAWALHNRETSHGITWHVMTEQVDAGDILKQVIFPLSEGETKERLDQRCYLTGMRAFRELLIELKAGTHTRTVQDLSRRTYYARSSPILPNLPDDPYDTPWRTTSGQRDGSAPCCWRKAWTQRSRPNAIQTLCIGPPSSSSTLNARPKKSV